MVRAISLNMNFFCFSLELVKVHGGYMLTRHVGLGAAYSSSLATFSGFQLS